MGIYESREDGRIGLVRPCFSGHLRQTGDADQRVVVPVGSKSRVRRFRLESEMRKIAEVGMYDAAWTKAEVQSGKGRFKEGSSGLSVLLSLALIFRLRRISAYCSTRSQPCLPHQSPSSSVSPACCEAAPAKPVPERDILTFGNNLRVRSRKLSHNNAT